jgi:hypothetical protein
MISQAVCHSENIHLIQVDSTCTHIYFSGHERDDFFDHINSPTSIVIRYEKYLQRLHFTIYIPERPLRIELSDTKLSRINGWFVTQRTGANHDDDDDDDDGDDDDADDDIDNEHNLHMNKGGKHSNIDRNIDDDDDDDDDVKCYPVYQQALVHIYTKFYRTTQSQSSV